MAGYCLGRFERLIEHREAAREPNWITGDLLGYNKTVAVPLASTTENGQEKIFGPLQQSDLLKPFLMDIAKHGLKYAYEKYDEQVKPVVGSEKTEHPKDVIIVGAGMAGLVAAHELKRAGHNVTILESRERVGGRIKTYDHKDGFKQGLHADGEYITMPLN